jgi:hypothetical protein
LTFPSPTGLEGNDPSPYNFTHPNKPSTYARAEDDHKYDDDKSWILVPDRRFPVKCNGITLTEIVEDSIDLGIDSNRPSKGYLTEFELAYHDQALGSLFGNHDGFEPNTPSLATKMSFATNERTSAPCPRCDSRSTATKPSQP